MKHYLGFYVQFHGLNIKTRKDLIEFQNRLKKTLQDFYPNRNYDSDLIIDLDESAGELKED
jgi:hypothetical protein